MLKKTLLLASFIALAACSEDVFQEIDEQNKEPEFQNSINSFDDSQPGDASSLTPGGGYVSPWDIWLRNDPYMPAYVFKNGWGEHSSLYTATVYAYVGLAYYDGNNNGIFYDVSQQSPGLPGVLIADMQANPGWYPNLYQNGSEVGNLIRTNAPVKIGSTPATGSEFAILSTTDHLPINQGSLSVGGPPSSAVNPNFEFFDLNGIATPEEQQLLADYGKVFYYEVIIEQAGTPIWSGFLHPDIVTLHDGVTPWQQIFDITNTTPIQSFIPPLGNVDLYYYNANLAGGTIWTPLGGAPGSFTCDSREIVMDAPGLNSFSFGSLGWTVSLYFTQGTTLWQGAGFTLELKP